MYVAIMYRNLNLNFWNKFNAHIYDKRDDIFQIPKNNSTVVTNTVKITYVPAGDF